MEITRRQVLKYTLLPGIMPRTTEMFSSGFSYISTFMAQALSASDLLPPNHPYLNPANTGRFGIRHVMAEARRNLVFRRENVDQIVIYYAMMAGLFILFFQFVMLTMALSVQAANAAAFGPWMGQFFVTPNPEGDIAFLLLDRTFGYQGLYGSCADPGIPCPVNPASVPAGQSLFPMEDGSLGPISPWPTQFHKALHWLFAFYDMGVAAVGMIMLTYMVATVTAETAQSGIPFGRRFNRSWVVPRLIVATVLLFPWDGPQPDNTYMNGAQSIVLHIAKWGSSLATNGWILFNNSLTTDTLGGNVNNLVVNPNPPTFNVFLQFMFVARTCKYAEERITQEAGQPAITIDAWQVDENNGAQLAPGPGGFNAALAFSDNRNIVLRFGQQSADFIRDTANVKAICGQMTIKVMDVATPGALAVQRAYYDMIMTRWVDPAQDTWAQNIVKRFTPVPDKDPTAPLPNAAFFQASKTWMNGQMQAAVTAGHNAAVLDPRWAETYLIVGWGGAAIWYNKIAEFNGSFVDSVFNLPQPDAYPEVMENIKTQRKAHATDDPGPEQFRPEMMDGNAPFWRKPAEDNIALALYYAKMIWGDQQREKPTASPVTDFIKQIFGVQGLYNMLDNVSVHPLAQLAGLGRSLIQATVIQLGGRAFAALIEKGARDMPVKAAGKFFGDAISSVTSITLVIGIFLYYFLPFLPFIYFFFAVGSWVKAVFEAMVGMPLWALSFARIDGQGLPGKSGMNGFYLLLEILIRPILIIFGLIFSVSIFSAQVVVMHSVWDLISTNIGGADSVNAAAATPGWGGAMQWVRDTIDGFCYTLMYTIIVYMLGLASFKLIDIMPKKILRWMGQSVAVFNSEGDVGQQFIGTGFQISQEIAAGMNKGIFALMSRVGK